MYGQYRLVIDREERVDGSSSKVDYVGLVAHERRGLVEANSPSVIMMVGPQLPAHGIELRWNRNESLVLNIIQKVCTRVLSSCNTNFDSEER